MPEEQKLRFKPRARIIRTIGDQLVSGPEAAVIELVKNAYDADATFVSIKFQPPLTAGLGRITIADNGTGMTLSDIRDKWMEPATSSKVAIRHSKMFKRQMMGSKGIGRFAAAKLGARMALNAVSQENGKKTEVLIPNINWDQFSGDAYLADIAIDYLTQETTLPTGTLIEISELTETWSETRLLHLYRELRRLKSPTENNSNGGFGVFFDLSDCTKETVGFDGLELLGFKKAVPRSPPAAVASEYEVHSFPLFDASDYEVRGSFDEAGVFSGTIEIRRGRQGPRPIDLSIPLLADEQPCGIVSVRLSIFDREAEVIRETARRAGMGNLTATQARQYLDSIVGVSIYRGGFRIRPYGDPQNDWLTLDTRRVQNPSLRIGHNQIVGLVAVEEQDISNLVERSSREGFEDGGPFRRLHRLISELLSRVVEPERQQFREDAGISRKKKTTFEEVKELGTLEELSNKLLPGVPDERRSEIQRVIANQSARLTEKIEALEERQRVLEAQSSLGQIIGEVLHEGAPSVSYLARTGQRLRLRYQHLFNNSEFTEQTKAEFPEKLALIQENGEKLQTLFATLRPLSGARRGPPLDFYGVDLAHSVAELFLSHRIAISVHCRGQQIRLFGYSEDLNTALVNLVGNSVYWLEQSAVPSPAIDIRFSWEGREAVIFVDDNGPGIPSEFVKSIFDVGFTLRNNGTGLGLNIAKEALARSGAKLSYHLEFEAGTRFEIRFPTVRNA